MSEGNSKKRKSSSAAGSKSKRGRYTSKETSNAALPVGEWGFLVSSDTGSERRARQEIIHLLLETKERIESQQKPKQEEQTTIENAKKENGQEGQLKDKTEDKQVNGSDKKVEEEDKKRDDNATQEESKTQGGGEQPVNIGQAFEDELKQLKSKEDKLFYHRDISQGMTFLSMKKIEGIPDPVQLSHSLLQDLQEKGESRTRFCIKLMPITHSCFASMDDINKLAKKIVEENFTKDDKEAKFSIQYDHRFGPELERMAVIDAFAQIVPCPPYKVDLNNPDVTIIVQIVKNSCGVSVVRDWKKFHKYNLREIVRIQNEKKNGQAE